MVLPLLSIDGAVMLMSAPPVVMPTGFTDPIVSTFLVVN